MWTKNRVEKLTIVAVDGFGGAVEAQYNPKEVQIDKTVTWNSETDHHVTYTKCEPRTVSMELLFDVFEHGGQSLDPMIAMLTSMSLPLDMEGSEEQRRPPVLKLGNGPVPGMLCVLEQLAIKVIMFDKRNRPVRATVNLKLKELTFEDRERLMGGREPDETPTGWYKAKDPRGWRKRGCIPPPMPPRRIHR